MTLQRHGALGVDLDLDAHLVVDGAPWQIRATRRSYGHPIVAVERIGVRDRALTDGLLKDLAGLPGFVRVTIADAGGATVRTVEPTFCPGHRPARRRPSAPATSPYPARCSTNPFALGAVWGIQAGWSASVHDPVGAPVDLPPGAYTARIAIAERYRALLNIPADKASATVALTVVDGPAAQVPAAPPEATLSPLQAKAARPTGPAVISDWPRPDLRPLPAGGMTVKHDAGRDYLAFFATVWNAGPAPLVIDAYRWEETGTMDAYQYFLDGDGRTVGWAPAGVLRWDDRDGHRHWHLADFASYRMLDAQYRQVTTSEKTGFCLSSTDPIDLTVPHANWQPANNDLRVGCGGRTVASLRQVLDVGSGDTYRQDLPGQSFDITDLPNGTYYVEVTANPERRLYETDPSNNISQRQVVLAGPPGARTVTAPPHQLVDAA
ncbi:hypothetical protein GCM10007977_060130 [Dactylosporangium sucinum]|uniref:Uncharacterized protein n=1 Tax=Dactylosporangium sucinum TaxID=1424081 RepID=A0A917U105_9ACTN|nr:hypothetical protein GCM10007977_060130 [Dactylosporangium sucinum]